MGFLTRGHSTDVKTTEPADPFDRAIPTEDVSHFCAGRASQPAPAVNSVFFAASGSAGSAARAFRISRQTARHVFPGPRGTRRG